MKDGKNFMGGWDKVITEQFTVIQTKVQTNEEWARTLPTTEKFAEFLLDVWYGIDDIINIMEREDVGKKEAMLIWLKEKHTDETEE